MVKEPITRQEKQIFYPNSELTAEEFNFKINCLERQKVLPDQIVYRYLKALLLQMWLYKIDVAVRPVLTIIILV